MSLAEIAQVVSTPMPPAEGISVYATGLSSYLRRRGYNVTILSNDATPGSELIDRRGSVRTGFSPPNTYPLQGFTLARLVEKRLSRLDPRPEMVHVHSPLIAGLHSETPSVVTFHTPIVADVLHYELWGKFGWLSRMQAPFSWLSEASVLYSSKAITAVSERVRRDLLRTHPLKRNVSILGNAVDPSEFIASDRMKIDPPVILHKGRLAPRKGVPEFLAAASALVEDGVRARFILSGTGPLAAWAERYIRSHRIQNAVKIEAPTSRENVPATYARASVFVLCSRYEGLSTALLEAMSCALPLVCTRNGSNETLVRDELEGLLVEVGDPEAVAEAIRRLIENPAFANELGQRARERVIKNNSWEVVGPKVERIYESCWS